MLQGHIDEIADGKISGWVYSRLQPVAGEQVLAYCGEQCIGAGEVGLFRADLRDAGLDDGRLGFQIRFDQEILKTGLPVHVRFNSSDFSLHPRSFWTRGAARPADKLGLYSQAEVTRLDWMAAQGWLSQDQYTMAKALNRMGVYQRTISRTELAGAPLETHARRIFAECLSLLFKLPAESTAGGVRMETFPEGAPFDATGRGAYELVGLFGTSFGCEIVEGAHRSDLELPADPPAMRYHNSPFQLMMVHAACLRSEIRPEGVAHVLHGAE